MASDDKPIKKRAVAATFLFRFADGSGNQGKAEVALFRRSAKVRTYQHKLAPISGSVEQDDASPLATAVREIEEETTLKLGSDIELMRKGKSYSFTDDDIGREWTVHPFAFRLKSTEEGGRGEAGITIDWEHEKWEWHDPHSANDSDDFGGVPRLTDSLRRVWPEYDLGSAAGTVLTAGLEDLRTDHESGARVIAAKAVRVLRDVISKISSIRMEVGIWWDNILPVAWHLCYNGRESMGAAIISSLVTVLARIEDLLKSDEEDTEEQKHRVISEIDDFLVQRESTISRIGAAFIEYIESTVFNEQKSRTVLSVLTISYSSTILSTLLGAAKFLNVDLDIRILESRPLCEGVTLASKLLEEPTLQDRIKVTLYTDASAAIAAQDVDVLLLGADRISSEGDVSNKTGTLPVALSTRHVSPATKIIVVSEVEKIAGPGAINDHCVEENSFIELSRIWDDEVKGAAAIRKYADEEHKDTALSVKNVYFEWLPAQLVDAYITDADSWSLDDIKARSQKIGVETDKFFSRCSGPSRVPCQRCARVEAECIFTAPRAARPLLDTSSLASSDKVALLEQRLNAVEAQLRSEICTLQRTVDELRPTKASRSHINAPSEISHTPYTILGSSPHNASQIGDNAPETSARGQHWKALHSFYNENCKAVVGFMDDQFYPPISVIGQHSLLSTVICLVASRAIMPEKYQSYLDEADDLVKKTFGGPTPDLLTVKALMLLAVWTGRSRLWGYVASIAAELKLNAAVIQLGDNTSPHSMETVDHARTWLSLCCFDLVMNLNRPFVINRMRDYLPFTANLLASPHRRPVDHRIAAYIEGFAIAADGKTQLQNTKLQVSPLPEDVTSLLDSSNQKIDRWFYEINNKMNPLYQTFQDKQDRNRFLVPYSFLKTYINGFALYGIHDNSTPDSIRLEYVQQALDHAILVIRTQCDSPALRKGLRYTMDYNGITTYNAINYILKAMTVAHQYLNYSMVFPALHQAAQMFEEAGSVEAANDIRREQDRVAMLTSTVLSPEVLEHGNAEREANELFDIPSFWDEANWDDAFPEMNVYTLD